jgi:two-component system chemotaxis response regulator CheY
LRVLTVDDELPIQDLYEAVIALAGAELSGQAFDGKAAVAMFVASSPPPDLVIMDYRMPVQDGLAAMQDILQADPGARVVFVSADGSVERAAREAGAVGFLMKPFPLAAFIALLKSFAAPPEGAPPAPTL